MFDKPTNTKVNINQIGLTIEQNQDIMSIGDVSFWTFCPLWDTSLKQ